jgi:hypothetical protein
MQLLLTISLLASFTAVYASDTDTPSTAGSPRTPARQMRTPEGQIQRSNNRRPATPEPPRVRPGRMMNLYDEMLAEHPLFPELLLPEREVEGVLSNRLARVRVGYPNLPLTPASPDGNTRVIDLRAARAAAARINRNHQASQGTQQHLGGQNFGQGEAAAGLFETPTNSRSPLLPPGIRRGQNGVSAPFFPFLEDAVADPRTDQVGQVSQGPQQLRAENTNTVSRPPNVMDVILPQRTDTNLLQGIPRQRIHRPPPRPAMSPRLSSPPTTPRGNHLL